MGVRDLIPWARDNGHRVPTLYRDEHNPVLSLHREVNRLFDDVFRSFNSRLTGFGPLSALDGGWPKVEISETAKEIKVTAEIAGIDEKDIDILLDDDVLTLKGEKRAESADEERQFSERYYGRFERRIPLGYEVEQDKVDARFRNGVLTIILPKSEKAQSQTRRIAIRH